MVSTLAQNARNVGPIHALRAVSHFNPPTHDIVLLKLGLLLCIRVCVCVTLANRFNTVLVYGILLCACVASA